MEGRTEKRRSFFDIHRKSLLFDQMFDEDNGHHSAKENNVITMKKYLALLKEERAQWKNVLESRCKQLELQQKNIVAREISEITAGEIEQFLDEEDMSFLNGEPDYLSMLESADKYLKAVEFLKRYKSDVIEHYNQIIEEAEMENHELVENLCQTGMCELCNQINCSNPDHQQIPVQ